MRLFPSGFLTITLYAPSPHPYVPHAQPITFYHPHRHSLTVNFPQGLTNQTSIWILQHNNCLVVPAVAFSCWCVIWILSHCCALETVYRWSNDTGRGNLTKLGEKPVQVPFCPPQITHNLSVNCTTYEVSPYRAVNTLRLCYTNQSVNAV